MTDIAELGFRINSRDAQTATGRLDRMTSAAGRTERQAQSLNRTMMIAAKGVAAFGGALRQRGEPAGAARAEHHRH